MKFIHYQVLQINKDFIKKNSEIDTKMNNLFTKIDKIPEIEKQIIQVNQKIKKKLSKYKEKAYKDSIRLLEVENNIKTLFQSFSSSKNTDNAGNKKETNQATDNINQNNEILKQELLESIENTKKSILKIDKEVSDLRNIFISKIRNELDEIVKTSSEEKIQMLNCIGEVKESVKDLQINEKFFISAISGKIGRDELDKNNKTLVVEFENIVNKILI